jgi:aryl-alcohol dehydrogenase-like predicted oxidoreductase
MGYGIPTADVYADTRSEQIIGRWLASRSGARDTVVIATKGRFATNGDPNGHGLSRRHLASALDASLRFLDDAVRAGKIHYVGLSNFTG